MKGQNSPRSGADNNWKDVAQNQSSRPFFSDHIDYGTITAVDYNTYQVQVQLFDRAPWEILGPGYWPLITQHEVLSYLYGRLRPGLKVRVHWRGRDTASFALVEVVGTEDANFFKQVDRPNSMTTGPYRLFSGGLIG